MKKLPLNLSFLVLFVFVSINGFGQTDTTTKKSDHPLLDKYYPRPKSDTIARNPLIKGTGVEKNPILATPNNKQTVVEPRLTFPSPVQRPETVPVVAQKDSLNENPQIAPVSKGIALKNSNLAIPNSDSAKIAKPVIAAVAPSPAKKSPPKSEPGYQRNRLGSSSPLYNTYEKNANGAGSVTTLPKR